MAALAEKPHTHSLDAPIASIVGTGCPQHLQSWYRLTNQNYDSWDTANNTSNKQRYRKMKTRSNHNAACKNMIQLTQKDTLFFLSNNIRTREGSLHKRRIPTTSHDRTYIVLEMKYYHTYIITLDNEMRC